MRVFLQGSVTSEPITDVYKNSLLIFSPESAGVGKIQYSLDNSRSIAQGTATWTDVSLLGSLSSTYTFVMPELGAVRFVNYSGTTDYDIKEWRSIVTSSGGGGGGGSSDASWQFPTGLTYNDNSTAVQAANASYLNTFFAGLAATGLFYSVKFDGNGTLYVSSTISIDVGKIGTIDFNNIVLNGGGIGTITKVSGPIIKLTSSVAINTSDASELRTNSAKLCRLWLKTDTDYGTYHSVSGSKYLAYNYLVDGIKIQGGSNGTDYLAPYSVHLENITITGCRFALWATGTNTPFHVYRDLYLNNNVQNIRYSLSDNAGEDHRFYNCTLGGGLCGNIISVGKNGTRTWMNFYGCSNDYPAGFTFEADGFSPSSPDTISTDANVTLTAANVINSISRTSLTTGRNDTLPSAADIIAALGTSVPGTRFYFNYNNSSNFTVNLLPGTGVSLIGSYFEGFASDSDQIEFGASPVYNCVVINATTVYFFRNSGRLFHCMSSNINYFGGHIEFGSSLYPKMVVSAPGGSNAVLNLDGTEWSDVSVAGSSDPDGLVFGESKIMYKHLAFVNSTCTLRMKNCAHASGVWGSVYFNDGIYLPKGEWPAFVGSGEVQVSGSRLNSSNMRYGPVPSANYDMCLAHGTWDNASAAQPMFMVPTGALNVNSLYTTGRSVTIARDAVNFGNTYYNNSTLNPTNTTPASFQFTKTGSTTPFTNIYFPIEPQSGYVQVSFQYLDTTAGAADPGVHGTFSWNVVITQTYFDENGMPYTFKSSGQLFNSVSIGSTTPTNAWKRATHSGFVTTDDIYNKYKWATHLILSIDLTSFTGTTINFDDFRVFTV